MTAAGLLLGTACGDSDSPGDTNEPDASHDNHDEDESDAGKSDDESRNDTDSDDDSRPNEDDAGADDDSVTADDDTTADDDSVTDDDAVTDDDTATEDAGTDGGSGEPDDELDTPPSSGQSWTLLVYMVADNNLEPFAIQDLEEMMQVGSGDALTILVQADRADGYADEGVGGVNDWTSTKRFKVEGGSLEELDDLGELNMGDPTSLSEFVQWGLQSAPSDRTALIFWDHGGGWNSFGGDEANAGDNFNLLEIQSGLEEGMAAAGRSTKFDLIGFDACLMATYETASALAPYAEYLLGSQELEPGNGWDWTSLQLLADDPTSNAAELGSRIVADYAQSEAADPTITLSLSHLGKLDALQEAFAGLSSALVDTDPTLVGRVRASASEFAQDIDLVDLQSLATALGAEDAALADVSEALEAAMGEVIVSLQHGAHRQFANGLSIYFPRTRAKVDPSYAQMPGTDEWRSYLDGYYDQGSEIEVQAGFTNPDHIGALGIDDNGYLLLQGDLAQGTAANLVGATTSFGAVVEGIYLLVGDNQGAWNDEIAQGSWDLTALVIEQNAVQTLLYYSESYSGDGTLSFTVPFSKDGEIVFYQLVLDADFNIVSEDYYQQVGEAWGAVAIVAGDLLQPIWQVLNDSGQVESILSPDVIDPNAEFNLSFEPFEVGDNVFMLLEIADFGGNTDFVYNEGTL
jgi:hypothetical protein